MSMLSAACAGKAHVCPVAKNPGIKAEALTTAAKKHDRSKASLAEAVLEQWQREEGFLK
jgi:hypothetical protein